MTRLYKNHFALIVFIFPAVLLFSVLLIYPILRTTYESFFTWNGIAQSPLEYVGLDNFAAIFTKPVFWNAMKNVGLFVIVGFVLQMPLAFLMALFTTGKYKGIPFFKTAFFMPVILPMTAIGIMWRFILWPDGGMLNALLQAAWNKLKYLYTTIATKANLTSPALTGTPTAPTAAAGTNTTQLATTAFVTAADNLKANLASPTFTGTPAAPTAAAGTNTTQLATTAFVTAAANLKLNLAGGTLTGQVVAQDSADATKRVRNIQLSTTDLTAGTSALANGIIYFVYE